MILAGVVLVMANGCAMARSPVTGFVYSNTQAGLGATSNQAGNRVGKACATSYLGAFASGDATIETARRNGGITLITSVDEESSSILGVYAEYCTVVRGR
jgi:hypothetical protein